MNMDTRIEPKYRPMYGCHSEFDHLRQNDAPPCTFKSDFKEKACENCTREKTSSA